jgi:hypothetical protein
MNDRQLLFDFVMEDESLRSKFIEFHRKNPAVYVKLRDLAIDLRNRGHGNYGIKGLLEVLRWHTAMETTGDPYKINNNYAPYYARMIMHNEPALDGFFRTRVLRSE